LKSIESQPPVDLEKAIGDGRGRMENATCGALRPTAALPPGSTFCKQQSWSLRPIWSAKPSFAVRIR